MKKLSIFLVLFCGTALWSAARARETGSDDPGVKQRLMQIEREWARAMMENDAAALERIEGDDYAYLMDGMKGDKRSDVNDAKSHAYAGTVEITDMQARVFGNAAIVTGKVALREAKYKGKDITGDYLFTDVFINMNGRWQAVASHSNKAQAGM